MKGKKCLLFSLIVTSIFLLIGCSSTKEKTKEATKKVESELAIVPKGTYLYQSGSDYVKIDVISDTEWEMTTEELTYPEKIKVEDTGEEIEGYKLVHFSSESGQRISGHSIFTIFNDEGADYYVVLKDNKLTFVLNVSDDEGNLNVDKRANNNETRSEFLVKQ